jgi:hypothetical protein
VNFLYCFGFWLRSLDIFEFSGHWFLAFGSWMCSFLLGFLLLTVTFSHLQDFACINFCYLEAQGKAQQGISQKAVVPPQNRKNFLDYGVSDPCQENNFQTSFKGHCIFEQYFIGNLSENGFGRCISMGLSMWTAQQENSYSMCPLLGPLDQGTKHDVTPKQPQASSSRQWGNAWNDWDQWDSWEQDWEDTESVGRLSSQSPRRFQSYQNFQDDYSPRGRVVKGKGKWKGKAKGKSKTEQSANTFGSGKSGAPSLPSWPVWNNPEVAVSPFQTAQASKNSTMQEMAVHLRQAYKDSEPPADVQAFLDKADKEYSRNNIKSLQAGTKSLDHAQKALRDAVNAKKEHRLQWTKHVGDGIKVWEAQLESYRVHQATLSEHAARARAEIETSRRI